MEALTNNTKDYIAKCYRYMEQGHLIEKYGLPMATVVTIGKISRQKIDNPLFEQKFIKEINEIRYLWEHQPRFEIIITYQPKFKLRPRILHYKTFSKKRILSKLERIRRKEIGRYEKIECKLV